MQTKARKQLQNYMCETARAVDNYIIKKLADLKIEEERIYEITSYLVFIRKNNPKLRSTLGRLIYEMSNGNDWKEIIPILGFMELSTISTYVLDDIIDSQLERNGNQATHIKYNINYGIIAGSLQSFISLKMLDDLEINDSLKLEIEKLGIKMWEILWIGEGRNEHMKEGTSFETYFKRCYEVSGVMFETVARMCAFVAGAKDEFLGTCNDFGKQFGIAVMIRNDMTVFFPESLMKSKSKALARTSFEDIKKGIWTHPIISASKKMPNNEFKKINNLLGKDLSENELLEITRLLIKYGCIDETFDLISDYKNKLMKNLENFKDNSNRLYIQEMLNMLENTRNYMEDFKKNYEL